MSAAAYFWPETGRLEAYGTFPGNPGLEARGQADAVGDLYLQMQQRRELAVMGDRTVPIVEWIEAVLRRAVAENVVAIVADRFKAAEIGEALEKAGNRSRIIWRGMGFKDGSEDVERLRRTIFDGKVKSAESYLLRHAFAEAVVLTDPAGNCKPAKGRSMGRIDAACASMLAIAEGARML